MSWKMVRPCHSLFPWFLITDQDLSLILRSLGSEIPGEVKDGRVLANLLSDYFLLAIMPELLHRFTSFWPLFRVALYPHLRDQKPGLGCSALHKVTSKQTYTVSSLHNSTS